MYYFIVLFYDPKHWKCGFYLPVLIISNIDFSEGIHFCMRKLATLSSNLSSNISPKLNVLQLSLPNPLKPGVKSRMKI